MPTMRDLDPYDYLPVKSSFPCMLAVGWLGTETAFPVGNVSPSLIDRIAKLCAEPSNLMRGFHVCELCDEPANAQLPLKVGDHDLLLGNGEIHVTGKDGVVYSAPTLVLHYIIHHSYLPPPEFLEALSGTCSTD